MGTLRPLPLGPHGRHDVGRQERLQPRGVERHPVAQHGAAEVHHAVRRLRMELLAQKVQEGVAPPADLVDVRRDGAQLALGSHLAEIHGKRAQQLLGHEVDRADVGVQKARDVALEEVGVGDEHAAQPELDVERRREPLVERGVRLDDVHPAADLRQMVGIDHRLPLIGGSPDVGVLEAPRKDVLDEVVDRLDVVRLADRHADRLVTLEAHQQELVVAVAEERGEAAQDPVDVHVPVGVHELLDHAEQLDHRLLLAIAQRVVLQEEQAHREAVLEVLDLEQAVDRAPQDLGEQGTRRREQLLVGHLVRAADEREEALAGEEVEVPGDGRRVGEPGYLDRRPAGHVETLLDTAIAGQQHLAVELEKDGGQGRPPGHLLHQVAQQRVPLEERRGLPGQQPGQGLADQRQRVIVGGAVRSGHGRGAPHHKTAQRERELVGGERRVEQAEDQLREEPEQRGTVVGALEVRPVAQEGGLETLDQKVGVAEGVEVLAHGLHERGANAVQPFHRVHERQVALGDDHVLRRGGEVRAQRV